MLLQKLQADQIQALKTSNKEKLEVLRFILAKVKNREIEKKTGLIDEDVIDILRKHVKELNESITAFFKGGRTDLVEQTRKQLDIITPYLPAEMSDQELQATVKNLIEQNKASYKANPKSIIGICMRELKSKVSPDRIMKAINSSSSLYEGC